MDPDRLTELRDEVRTGFSTLPLSPAHRRIAYFVARDGERCIYMSAADVADEINVSQPSVTRFAKALNFRGWSDFRDALRNILTEPSTTRHSADWSTQAVADEQQNLRQLAENVPAGRYVELGRELNGSVPLVCLGVRATIGVCAQFVWYARKIHPDVRQITDPGDSAADQLLHARRAGAKVLLTFALPRFTRQGYALLGLAAELGFRIVVVAPADLAAGLPDGSLRIDVPIGHSLAFNTSVTSLLVGNLLLQGMIEAAPREAQQRLDDLDQLMAARHIYAGPATQLHGAPRRVAQNAERLDATT